MVIASAVSSPAMWTAIAPGNRPQRPVGDFETTPGRLLPRTKDRDTGWHAAPMARTGPKPTFLPVSLMTQQRPTDEQSLVRDAARRLLLHAHEIAACMVA